MTREEAISEWTFRSNHIKKWLDEYGEEPSIRHYVELIDMAIEALSEPSIVRCEECKSYLVMGDTTKYGWCKEHETAIDEWDFCSYGERRVGEKENDGFNTCNNNNNNANADNKPRGMSDLISRADAMRQCKNAENELTDEAEQKGVRVARFIIGELPSADRPQVEWIKHKGEWVDFDFYPTKYECSQCHYYVDEGYDSIFCPNCGARMKGGAE